MEEPVYREVLGEFQLAYNRLLVFFSVKERERERETSKICLLNDSIDALTKSYTSDSFHREGTPFIVLINARSSELSNPLIQSRAFILRTKKTAKRGKKSGEN